MSLPRCKSAINKLSGTDDLLPSEEEINEWTRRSRDEGRHMRYSKLLLATSQSGVKNALIITVQNIFPRTLIYYQMAILNILVSSSNEGLERYMDDEIDDSNDSNEGLDDYMD